MRISSILDVLFTTVWLLFGSSWCNAQPQIDCPESVATDIRVGFTKTIVIPIKNLGSEILKIGTIKVSCGCVVTREVTHEIGPGASGSLAVEYTARPGSAVYEQSVAITSNDPAKPVVAVKVLGNILQFSPFTASATTMSLRRTVAPGNDPLSEIVFSNDKPFQIEAATVSSDRISARVVKLSKSKAVVEVRGLASNVPFETHAMLKVSFAINKPETVEIPIDYAVLPLVSVSPQVLLEPPAESTSSFTRFVIISNDGSAVHVDKIQPRAVDGLSFDCKDSDGRVFLVAKGMPVLKSSSEHEHPEIDVYVNGGKEPIIIPVK